MINFYSGKIADEIIAALVGETLSAKEIGNQLRKAGDAFSTAGLYKALKQLEHDGVIVKLKKRYSINTEWRQSIVEALGYQESIDLEGGESVTFTFQSAEQADKHWKHLAILLQRESAQGVCFYNPHQFWIHVPGRVESEKKFLDYFKEHTINVYHTVGGTTEFDKAYRREYTGGSYQIHLECIESFPPHRDVTVFGDYIITTQSKDSLYADIDGVYKKACSTEELKEGIARLMAEPHDFRLKLERNHQKAVGLSKRLKKHFI